MHQLIFIRKYFYDLNLGYNRCLNFLKYINSFHRLSISFCTVLHMVPINLIFLLYRTIIFYIRFIQLQVLVPFQVKLHFYKIYINK